VDVYIFAFRYNAKMKKNANKNRFLYDICTTIVYYVICVQRGISEFQRNRRPQFSVGKQRVIVKNHNDN